MRGFAWHKTEDVFTPGRLAAQVRSQVNHWAVAAGAGHQVAVQPLAGAGDFVCFDVNRRHACSGHVLAATGFDHGAAGEDANTFGAGFFHQGAAWVVTHISHGDHLQARIKPVQRDAVGVVVVGRQHQFLPGATP